MVREHDGPDPVIGIEGRAKLKPALASVIWVGVLLVFCFQQKIRAWAIGSLVLITVLEVVLFMLR
jgi:hypothetical protein